MRERASSVKPDFGINGIAEHRCIAMIFRLTYFFSLSLARAHFLPFLVYRYIPLILTDWLRDNAFTR